MKIFVRALLSVLLSLTACSTVVWHQLPTEPQQAQGQLLIWHPFENTNAKTFEDALTEYERVHAGVRIISEYIPQTEISARFIKQFQSGLGPDLMVNFSTEIPALIHAETLQELDQTSIALSSYTPQALTQVRYRGGLYGVPLNSQLRVLCYNQAIVGRSSPSSVKQADSGLAAQTDARTVSDARTVPDAATPVAPPLTVPPTTLKELIQHARAGYSVGLVSTFVDTFWGIQIFGGQLYKANQQVPSLQGWSQWLTWLRQAANEPNVVLGQQRFVLHDAFLQGKLAYYVCDSTEVADFKPTLKDNFAVALLPGESDHPAGPLLYTRALLLSRNASPAQTRLAYQLAQFLTNPEQQIKSVVQSQDFLPVNPGVTIDRHVLPIEAVLLDQATTSVSIPLDDLDKIEPIMDQGELLFRQAIIGDITPTEADTQLTQAVNQALGSP